jgi:tetratricopeptide (TPR) repeat protein/DNA-binding CsgD family transcriptional regulator
MFLAFKLSRSSTILFLFIFSLAVLNTTTSAQKVYLDSLIRTGNSLNFSDTTRIKAFIDLVDFYRIKGIKDSLKKYYHSGLELASNQPNKFRVPVFDLLYAEYELFKGSLDTARKYLPNLHSDEFHELPKFYQAKTYNSYGVYNRFINRYDSAAVYLQMAFRVNEEMRDTSSMIINLINLGGILELAQYPDKAKETYERGLELASPDKYMRNRRLLLSNMGILYRKKKDYDKALSFYEESLVDADSVRDANLLANTFNNMANIYDEQKNYSKAESYYYKTLRIDEKSGSYSDVSQSHSNLANTFMKQNKLVKADFHAQRALEFAKKASNQSLIKEIYKRLSDIESKRSNYKLAYEFLEKHKELSDSLNKVNNSKVLAELQTKFDVETKNKDLKIKALELEQLKTVSRNKTIQIALISITLGSMLIAIYVMYLRQKQKYVNEKQELEHEKKLKAINENLFKVQIENSQLRSKQLETQITNYALDIITKNDFIHELKDRINKLKPLTKTFEARKEIESILDSVFNFVSPDKQKEEFHLHVQQVCNGFYLELDQRFPDLTPNERRLAALLRLNFSSKEIASLFGINPSSVDMNRYRLRKKFGLQSDDNIVDFLKGIDSDSLIPFMGSDVSEMTESP